MPRETPWQEAERLLGYDRFWRETFGHWPPTEEEITNELRDFKMLIDNLTTIYCGMTGGMVSKPNTDAEVVIGLYQEELGKEYDRGYADALTDHGITAKD